LQASPGRKFVFDPDLETSRKLGWQAASTPEGIAWQFDNKKPVVFYPGKMFPDDYSGALDYFCKFTLGVSRTVNGPKLLAIDEIQQFTEMHLTGVPDSLKACLNVGRREELDILLAAQGINDINSRIRKQATEIYVFKVSTADNTALKALAEMGFSAQEILSLPYPSTDRKVGWIYFDQLRGKKLRVIKPCT
jgi:hypothetical protein